MGFTQVGQLTRNVDKGFSPETSRNRCIPVLPLILMEPDATKMLRVLQKPKVEVKERGGQNRQKWASEVLINQSTHSYYKLGCQLHPKLEKMTLCTPSHFEI